MAEKRMFTKKVTDDENFLSLSSAAQALYLHLLMSADDDGFSNQISVSMFKAHASVSDLQSLLEKRYIYQFDSGVIVIKHWRMANALRKDRYTQTTFTDELRRLKIKENGAYTLADDGVVADWLPTGCHVVAGRLPQSSIDKSSIDKVSIDKSSITSADAQENPFDGVLAEAYADWLAYKKERREPYKPTGLKSLVTQITNAARRYGDKAVADVISYSMSCGYRGIIFDRLADKKKQAAAKNGNGNPFLEILDDGGADE